MQVNSGLFSNYFVNNMQLADFQIRIKLGNYERNKRKIASILAVQEIRATKV